MIPSSTTLFRLLRDYLLIKGFKYTGHSENNTLIYPFAHGLVEDKDNGEFATEKLKSLHSGRTVPQKIFKDLFIANPRKEQTNEREIAYKMFQLFKREDSISGRLDEYIDEDLKTNGEACLKHNLSETQVAQYLRNLFDGEPKLFNTKKFIPRLTNYGNAKGLFD